MKRREPSASIGAVILDESMTTRRDQLLRFQFEAHGKFKRKRQSEKITKRVWFLPRLGPADGCWPGKEHPERLPEAVWDWKVRLKN